MEVINMDNDLVKIIEYGEKILNVERIIIATKHMEQGEEIKKIMKEIKVKLVNQIISEYDTIEIANPTPVDKEKQMIQDMKSKLEDEDKTLEQLTPEPEPEPEPIKRNDNIGSSKRKTTKKNAYSRK